MMVKYVLFDAVSALTKAEALVELELQINEWLEANHYDEEHKTSQGTLFAPLPYKVLQIGELTKMEGSATFYYTSEVWFWVDAVQAVWVPARKAEEKEEEEE